MKTINSNLPSIIDDAWLNIVVKSTTLSNPLISIPEVCRDEPYMYFTWLMSQPEYFSLFCSQILNIQLLPIQVVILQELWHRKFPMLVGSRGFGKCIRDSYIITNSGFKYINNLFIDKEYNQQLNIPYSILGESGFAKPNYGYRKLSEPTIKLTTSNGFDLEGSLIHPIRVVENGQIIWRELQHLKSGDKIVIDRKSEWFPETNNIDVDTAYLFGCLVGDGGYTVRGRITLTSKDTSLIDKCNSIASKLWGKVFRKQKYKYAYLLCGIDIWDELFDKYGFNSFVCSEKSFPTSILSAPKSSMAAFIRGLFDTDGYSNSKMCLVGFCSKSLQLVKVLQFVLTKFGIISRRYKRLNKKYNTYYYYLNITGESARIFCREIGFGLKRKQDILEQTCKTLSNANKDVLPRELILNKLLNLRTIYKQYHGFKGHGYKYQISLLTVCRLKQYEISYQTLDVMLHILSECEECKKHSDYNELRHIQQQNYFYDVVTDLENSSGELYDFYIEPDHSYISGGFISHNSFLLGLYALLRMAFLPGRKIVICGAAFRQSKIIFSYMENIWKAAPLLRDMVGTSNNGPYHEPDMYTFRIGESITQCIPIGDGTKIRGLRAHDILSDEFASIPRDIFENVIAGFGAVSSNPIESVKRSSRKQIIKKLNQREEEDLFEDIGRVQSNQIIISGTAYYEFNHFAEYWKRWKSIINSKGSYEKLNEVFNDESIPDDFDWRDYSIIRIPYDLLPHGFMDDGMVARSKATVHSGIFNMEFNAIFSSDSNGFFRRSLIESCVTSTNNPIIIGGKDILFTPMLIGDSTKRYIYGIDPASEIDNFSIVILEENGSHRRVVYVWTTNKKSHKEDLKQGLVTDTDFYSYCTTKIRTLMTRFPCARIAVDSQGGGIAIAESLHDNTKCIGGQLPIWPVIDPLKEKDTDGESGLHILEMINFASAEWTSEANHGLKKDFEDKVCLFPSFDASTFGLAALNDTYKNRTGDSLEDCILEIEELKNELSTIMITQTTLGRDRWDVPEIKLPGGKKGRMRKDRYSALLMANMVARKLAANPPRIITPSIGGFATSGKFESDGGPDYMGPSWFTTKMSNIYD